MTRVRQWWQARNRREQRMLAVMLVAIAAFVYAFGMWRPLSRLRDGARARYLLAAAAHLRNDAALRSLAGAVATPAGDHEARLQRLRDSAARAGIEISRHGGDAAGGPSVTIARVTPAQLWGWLDRLREDDALVPLTLHVERRDGALEAQLQFPPAIPGATP